MSQTTLRGMKALPQEWKLLSRGISHDMNDLPWASHRMSFEGVLPDDDQHPYGRMIDAN